MNEEQLIKRGVLTVCAWCDKERGVTRPDGTSHGICREHADEIISEIEVAKQSGGR